VISEVMSAFLFDFLKPLTGFAHTRTVSNDSTNTVNVNQARRRLARSECDGRPETPLWKFGAHPLYDRNVLFIVSQYLTSMYR
jgi:hypothetical protein